MSPHYELIIIAKGIKVYTEEDHLKRARDVKKIGHYSSGDTDSFV
jgi:hypothetical protein